MKNNAFWEKKTPKLRYTSSLRPAAPASMGVRGVTPGNFQNLDAKWCIFLHSELICSNEVILENFDEKQCCFGKNDPKP